MSNNPKCCDCCSKYPPVIAAIHGKPSCRLMYELLIRSQFANPRVDAMEWLIHFTRENGCGIFEECDMPFLRVLQMATEKKISFIELLNYLDNPDGDKS